MTFSLIDDGTLDTVIRCNKCGEWIRYDSEYLETYDGSERENWALSVVEDDHQCDPTTLAGIEQHRITK